MAKKLALLLFVVILVAPVAAFGVWGGEPDGNDHPSVGAMYVDFDGSGGQDIYELQCSGSYAGPSEDGNFDVFLTAGHCLPPAFLEIPAFIMAVSFDNNNSGMVPDGLITVEEYHQMPGFGHDRGDLHDLGILLLPKGSVFAASPAAAAEAVVLPTENYLDDLKRSKELKRMTADVVGYGVTPVWEPGGPTWFDYDGVRKAGTSVINGLTKSTLLYNQNPNGIGTGSGVCFGDSGSPQFETGTLNVLSVTSGGNGQCNSVNNNYRVDTPQAREFLGEFLVLP